MKICDQSQIECELRNNRMHILVSGSHRIFKNFSRILNLLKKIKLTSFTSDPISCIVSINYLIRAARKVASVTAKFRSKTLNLMHILQKWIKIETFIVKVVSMIMMR